MTDNKEPKMKRFVIIFISLIVGYALYWCISDYNYRYNKPVGGIKKPPEN